MSYEKVKSIKFDKATKTVFITSACNNLRPLRFEKWECNGYSKVWKEQGFDAMFGHFLDDINGGNLHFYSGKYKEFADYTNRQDVKAKYPELSWDWVGDACKAEMKQPDYNEWKKDNPDKDWKDYEETEECKAYRALWDSKLEIRRSKLLECWKDFESKKDEPIPTNFTFEDLVKHLDRYKTMIWNDRKIRAFYNSTYNCICEFSGRSRTRGFPIISDASNRFDVYKGYVKLA